MKNKPLVRITKTTKINDQPVMANWAIDIRGMSAQDNDALSSGCLIERCIGVSLKVTTLEAFTTFVNDVLPFEGGEFFNEALEYIQARFIQYDGDSLRPFTNIYFTK